MLRSFRFANHKSFRDEQELLLMPAYNKERLVVPVTGIYGANASGKSNLIDALRFMVDGVRHSYSDRGPRDSIPRHPFKLDRNSYHEPSWYVVEIVVSGVRYTYGFLIRDDRIVEEWLFSYPHNRRRKLFERNGDDIEFGPSLAGPKSAVRDLLLPDVLFLSLGARLRLDPISSVSSWFQSIAFIVASRGAQSWVASRFANDPEKAKWIRALARSADLGIQDIEVYEDPESVSIQTGAVQGHIDYLRSRIANATSEDERHELSLDLAAVQRRLAQLEDERAWRTAYVHSDDSEIPSLSYHEESAGTAAWLHVLWHAADSLDQGSPLIVDELDSSLHPLLAARLIEIFKSPTWNPNGAQLLFTAHDTTLLGSTLGETPLERDGIWFVEKDRSGASRLYPLSDFKPRKDGENIQRRYLGGSYGAVPFLPNLEFMKVPTGVGGDGQT